MRPAALFDLDRTLVTVNSARLYVQWRMARSEASWLDYARVSGVLLRYMFGMLDAEEAARDAFRTVRGHEEARMREECRVWYERVVRRHISRDAQREVERCRAAGQVIAILSASTPYVTEPLAADLGIEHVLCTRLAIADGCFTGDWEPPLCYGAGKVEHARRWALEHGVDLARSAFYTDSISDLPMLEAVGEPRVINPDPRLRLVAALRRYPVAYWR